MREGRSAWRTAPRIALEAYKAWISSWSGAASRCCDHPRAVAALFGAEGSLPFYRPPQASDSENPGAGHKQDPSRALPVRPGEAGAPFALVGTLGCGEPGSLSCAEHRHCPALCDPACTAPSSSSPRPAWEPEVRDQRLPAILNRHLASSVHPAATALQFFQSGHRCGAKGAGSGEGHGWRRGQPGVQIRQARPWRQEEGTTRQAPPSPTTW
jgi:hypothetical protein